VSNRSAAHGGVSIRRLMTPCGSLGRVISVRSAWPQLVQLDSPSPKPVTNIDPATDQGPLAEFGSESRYSRNSSRSDVMSSL
jgi:hypothetical protein